jgi:hypothetical protein
LNGDKDVQVPSRQNLEGIKNALLTGGKVKTTIRELTGLNHAFQECETGMPDEYATIRQAFSLIDLLEIQKWIVQQCQ